MATVIFNGEEIESIWKEIRNDFVIDNVAQIFAWENENEKGKMIAKVNVITSELIILDERANTDAYAQEMIKEVLEDVKMIQSNL